MIYRKKYIPLSVLVTCLFITTTGASIRAQDFEELSLRQSISIAVNNARQQKSANIAETIFHTRTAYQELDKLQSLIIIHKEYLQRLHLHHTSINELYEKGLLGKVDLLEVKAKLATAELSLLELQEQYKHEEIAFNTLLNRISNTPIGTQPMPNVIKKYRGFEEWLHEIGAPLGTQSYTIQNHFADLPENRKAVFYALYESVLNKKDQITLCQNIIERSERVIELQSARFKNSLTSSNSVLSALVALLDGHKKYIEILHDYHTAMAEAEYQITSVIK
jgi:outer membrane protein TolC